MALAQSHALPPGDFQAQQGDPGTKRDFPAQGHPIAGDGDYDSHPGLSQQKVGAPTSNLKPPGTQHRQGNFSDLESEGENNQNPALERYGSSALPLPLAQQTDNTTQAG